MDAEKLHHAFRSRETGAWKNACTGGCTRTNKHVNSWEIACISVHIELEHVITCTNGCAYGKMHVDSFSDAL